VEFGLLLPVLLVVLAGLVDAGRLIVQSMQVRGAAQAGVDYVRSHPFEEATVESVAAMATPLPVTAQAAQFTCTSGVASNPSPAKSTVSCPANATGVFVSVTSAPQSAFRPLMPWPGGFTPPALSASSTVQVQ
jgi:Flp pilus assembly protein TadG